MRKQFQKKFNLYKNSVGVTYITLYSACRHSLVYGHIIVSSSLTSIVTKINVDI